MTSTRIVFAISVLLVGMVGASALAAPVVYVGENDGAAGTVTGVPVTARTAFLAALGNAAKLEGFESFSPGATAPQSLNFQGSSGSLGATLTGPGQINGSPANGRFNTTAGGKNYWEVDSSGNLTVDFGSNLISAFGFYGTDIGDFVTGALSIGLTDENDVLTVFSVKNFVNASDGSLLFWGFTDSSKKYKKIDFRNIAGANDVFGLDDMIVVGDIRQTQTQVPEPASLALVGIALAGLAACRRRKP